MNEMRNSPRYRLSIPTRLLITEPRERREIVELKTKDICSEGAFFDTCYKLPVGTRVEMDLILNIEKLVQISGMNSCVKLMGEVLRQQSDGFAVRFERNYEIIPLRNA